MFEQLADELKVEEKKIAAAVTRHAQDAGVSLEDAAVSVRDFLAELFHYHKPFGDQSTRYEAIRAAGKNMALVVLSSTPAGSREQALALDAIRSAIMWANAAIACNEKEPDPIPSPSADAPQPEPSVAPLSTPQPETPALPVPAAPEPEAAPVADPSPAPEAPAQPAEAAPAEAAQ